ncbi:MFS-type transporter SLC18B1-like [Tachypleus tridentatus]
MMNVLTGLLFMGFNEATLEPHIRKFYLQPSIVGLFFLVSGGCYAIGTLCWGHMSDKVPHSRVPLLVSSFICVLALLFIGPVPFIPLDTSIWLVILCQVFIGIGSAGKLVAGYNSSLTNAISRGFPNDATTMAVITGVFSAVLAIGGFVGPSLGGVLLDNIGYENGTCVLLGLEMTILFLNVAHIFWYNLCRRRDVSDDMVPIVAAD